MLEPVIATKAKSLATYFWISIPAVAFLGLDIEIMIVWFVLMLIDTFLGWVIAFWFSEFKSRTAQDRIARKGVLVVVLCSVAIMGTIYPAVAYVAQTMMMTFAIAELVSILRHWYTIYAKERLPEVDVIKILLKKSIEALEKKSKK